MSVPSWPTYSGWIARDLEQMLEWARSLEKTQGRMQQKGCMGLFWRLVYYRRGTPKEWVKQDCGHLFRIPQWDVVGQLNEPHLRMAFQTLARAKIILARGLGREQKRGLDQEIRQVAKNLLFWEAYDAFKRGNKKAIGVGAKAFLEAYSNDPEIDALLEQGLEMGIGANDLSLPSIPLEGGQLEAIKMGVLHRTKVLLGVSPVSEEVPTHRVLPSPSSPRKKAAKKSSTASAKKRSSRKVRVS